MRLRRYHIHLIWTLPIWLFALLPLAIISEISYWVWCKSGEGYLAVDQWVSKRLKKLRKSNMHNPTKKLKSHE